LSIPSDVKSRLCSLARPTKKRRGYNNLFLVSQGFNSFVNSGIIIYIVSRTIIDTPTNELNMIRRPIVSWRITGSRDCSESQEEITISFALSLGTLADSGELIYPLVVTGKVSMNEIRRIMGEAALLRNIQEPPMKYVLCRENSLADMITNARALENVEGVKSVEISLNREVLVSTHLRHSLIREEIMKKMDKNRVA
jgi:hypothetical protein